MGAAVPAQPKSSKAVIDERCIRPRGAAAGALFGRAEERTQEGEEDQEDQERTQEDKELTGFSDNGHASPVMSG